MMFWFFSCLEFNGTYKEVPWIDITQFTIADPLNDIFPDHQPDEIDCTANGFQVELDQLEIQTDICNNAIVEWTTQYYIPTGTNFEALVLHTGLWAPEDGNAHFALSIDGELFWEEFPVIPSNTEFFFYEAKWPEQVFPGTTVQLHLHNHGANDWKLGYFQPIESE